jgi:hypothetical protein
VSHERPEFITFNSQTTLFFDRTRTSRGTLRYFSLTYVCNQRSDTPTARAMPARERRSSRSLVIVQAAHLSSPQRGDGLGGGARAASGQARRLRTQASGIAQTP